MLAYSLTLLRRRLGVVALSLVLSLAAGGLAFVLVAPVQHSEAAVLFVPSASQPGVDGPTNPLLSLGGAVAIVASVVQVSVTDDQTQTTLMQAGDSAVFTVLPDLSENAGPILLVTTEDKDPAVSQRTRDALVDEIRRRLSSLQTAQKVQPDLRVSAVVLTQTLHPTVIRKQQLQVSVIAFGALLLICLSIILYAEVRRRRREPARRGGGREPGARGPHDPDHPATHPDLEHRAEHRRSARHQRGLRPGDPLRQPTSSLHG